MSNKQDDLAKFEQSYQNNSNINNNPLKSRSCFYYQNLIQGNESFTSNLFNDFIFPTEEVSEEESLFMIPEREKKLTSILDNCFSTKSTDGSEDSLKLFYAENKNNKSFIFKEDKNSNYMNIDRTKRFWSKKEDTLLLNYIKENSSKNWKLISEHIQTKTPQQCAYRYGKLMSDMNKKKWTRKDDIKLLDLVESHGNDWQTIAQYFNDRNDRDVEFRYKEKLDPNVKKTEFTEDEDNLIVKLHEEMGNKWYEISRHFKTRNSKMIKKRYQTHLKQYLKTTRKPKSISQKNSSSNLLLNTPSESYSYNNSSGINNFNHSEVIETHKDPEEGVENSFEYIERNLQDFVVNEGSINQFNKNKPITIHNNYEGSFFNYGDVEKDESFNVDMFFEHSFNQNCIGENLKTENSCKNIELSFHKHSEIKEPSISLTSQFEKLDDYLKKLSNSYKEKCREIEEIFDYNKKKGVNTSELSIVNMGIDDKVEELQKQAQSIKEEIEISNYIGRNSILKYIEIIILYIQQMKAKIGFIQRIHAQGKFGYL